MIVTLSDDLHWWSPIDADEAIDTSEEEETADTGVKALLRATGQDNPSKKKSSSKKAARAPRKGSFVHNYITCYVL